jgi:protein-S-isoprenylcysteine O-methyltransferase Ste14
MYGQVVQSSRQSLIDLVVALVSVPLLVVFGLMLENNMRGDWTRDGETRWYVLSLGIVLLLVSIMVCSYVTHRLGICIWAVAQEPSIPRHRSNVSSGSLQESSQQCVRILTFNN